jgi:hypothetical protein
LKYFENEQTEFIGTGTDTQGKTGRPARHGHRSLPGDIVPRQPLILSQKNTINVVLESPPINYPATNPFFIYLKHCFMRINKPLSSFYFFGISLTLLFLFFSSCKKNKDVESAPKNDLIKKFFKVPDNANEALKSLIAEIKKQDDTNHFAEQLARKYGLPLWESQLTNANTKHNQRGSSDNDSLIFFIPFQSLSSPEITSYMVGLKVGTKYNFRFFRKNVLDTLNTTNKQRQKFLRSALSVYAHFEKLINKKDSLFIDGIYKKYISETSISFDKQLISSGRASSRTGNIMYGIEVCYKITCNGGGGGGGDEELPARTSSFPAPCYDCYTYWYIDWVGGGGSGTGWWDNSGGGTPSGSNTSVALDYLLNSLDLNSSQQAWLAANPFVTDQVYQALQESLNQDPLDDYTFPILPPQDALSAAQITIDAAMNSLIYGPYDDAHYNLIKQYIPGAQNFSNVNPFYWFYFSMQCAIIKAEHPEYTTIQVYWEAIKDIVHLGLDTIGLFPVVGELADLANGVIYTLEGDGVNATLSFAATIPVTGTWTTLAKYGKKIITALDGSTRTLKW